MKTIPFTFCTVMYSKLDFVLQLQREPDNEEASRSYHEIEPLHEEIKMAKSRVVNNDCKAAIPILTKVIEVGNMHLTYEVMYKLVKQNNP